MSRDEYAKKHRMAFWNACEETGDQKTVLEILGNGFPVNTDLDGTGTPGDYTGLHAACTSGFADLVDLLVDKRANLNAKANKDRTALHLAAKNDKPDCVQKLLDAGADPFPKDAGGKTAMQLAEQFCPRSDAIALLAEAEKKAFEKPKSPMLNPRKQIQLKAELEALAAAEASVVVVPGHMPGACHLPWTPTNNDQINIFNVGAHGSKRPCKGSVFEDYVQPKPQPNFDIHAAAGSQRGMASMKDHQDMMIGREDWLYWDEF